MLSQINNDTSRRYCCTRRINIATLVLSVFLLSNFNFVRVNSFSYNTCQSNNKLAAVSCNTNHQQQILKNRNFFSHNIRHSLSSTLYSSGSDDENVGDTEESPEPSILNQVANRIPARNEEFMDLGVLMPEEGLGSPCVIKVSCESLSFVENIVCHTHGFC